MSNKKVNEPCKHINTLTKESSKSMYMSHITIENPWGEIIFILFLHSLKLTILNVSGVVSCLDTFYRLRRVVPQPGTEESVQGSGVDLNLRDFVCPVY